MTTFKKILQDHKSAIFLAILTSIIVALPQVYFRIDHQEFYEEGIQAIEMLPDSPWSARIREIQDGHGLGNMYQKGNKDIPYLFQPFGSMMVAYMGNIFDLDINNTLLLSRLVFPFIVFLFIYGFVLLLSRDKLVAICSAAVILLADSLLSYSGISLLLQGDSPDRFLRLARPGNPAMIYLFLFAFLFSFWQFYRKEDQQWRWGIASSIFLGLNFYNYFYTWTYLYAFGGILVLIFLIQNKWKEVLRVSSVFLGALLVAIPYFINMYQGSLLPTFEELGMRSGIILTHYPLFVGSSVIAALLVFLLFFPKEDKGKYIFGLAILLAPFVTMNQQILTGRIMQADHYHWFFHKPIGVIFVLITIFYLLHRRGLIFYKKALGVLIITVSIATAVFVQTNAYYYGNHDGGEIAIERQKYTPVMDWLNKNAEKEAMVFGNDETSNIVVIYTPLNVFYHRGVCCTSLSVTKSRLHDIMFSFFRLRGVDAEFAQDAFSQERTWVSMMTYGIYYRKLNGTYESIPDEKFEDIVALYKETLSTPTSEWLYEIWEKYEIEYFVWDKGVEPQWRLDTYPFLEEAAVFGDIAIYRFK